MELFQLHQFQYLIWPSYPKATDVTADETEDHYKGMTATGTDSHKHKIDRRNVSINKIITNTQATEEWSQVTYKKIAETRNNCPVPSKGTNDQAN